MPEENNAKMSEPESKADENKELSEDARDLDPWQEGLVRIGVATMRTGAGDALKMADVDANKQRYEPYGAAGQWVYKFDRLRADDSPVHSLPEHEGEAMWDGLVDEMFAAAVETKELDCDENADATYLIFSDGTGMDWCFNSDGEYMAYTAERTADIKACGFRREDELEEEAMSDEDNNEKMSEAESRKGWARAPQDRTTKQLDELEELDAIYTEEELAAMFVFDYDRFAAGVAACYDHPALDHSFVIGAGYEFVREFPEMAREFLGEFDAVLPGGLRHEDGKREPTENRISEIFEIGKVAAAERRRKRREERAKKRNEGIAE